LPGLDQGGKGVLAEDLQEDEGVGGVEVPLVGPVEDNRLHLQFVEIAVELTPLARAQYRVIGFEIGLDTAGGEVLLELEDKVRDGLFGQGGGGKKRQEKDPDGAAERKASLHTGIITNPSRL
jgi:hypothetical protein